jgi:hypothetical protein
VEAYRKTLGGTRKFTGAELFMALLAQIQIEIPVADLTIHN